MTDPYRRDYPSPSGGYVVTTIANEVKMSHWIEATVIVDPHGTVILDCGSSWSADRVTWVDATHVRLELRHYPGDRSADAIVDVEARAGRSRWRDGHVRAVRALAGLSRVLALFGQRWTGARTLATAGNANVGVAPLCPSRAGSPA